MPKLAANLTMMFQEDAFLKRFSSARSCGFKGVEFHFPYQWSKNDLADVLGENELEQVLFNLPSGNWEKGERGNAALPGREQEFRDGLGLALEYAQALGCKKIHAMAGVIQDEKKRGEMEEVFIENLRYGADICFKAGVQLLIEPLNTVDTPGYFLSSSALLTPSMVSTSGVPRLYTTKRFCSISSRRSGMPLAMVFSLPL